MSLNYDLTDIKDWEGLFSPTGKARADGTPQEAMDPLCDGLIWLMMSIGASRVTEDNLDELEHRLWMVQATAPMLYDYEGEGEGRKRVSFYVGRKQLERMVGLKVNVIDLTREEWKAERQEVAWGNREGRAYRLKRAVDEDGGLREEVS